MRNDFDNDWLRGDGDENDENTDETEFDWGSTSFDDKTDDKHTGVTGQLSWLKDDDDSSTASDDDGEDFVPDWIKNADQDRPKSGENSPRTGVTGQLSWLQQDDDDDQEQRDDRRTGVTGQLDWQKSSFEDQLEEAERAAQSRQHDPAEEDVQLPDWLRSSAPVDEEPAFEDEDDTPEWLRSSAHVDEEPLSEDDQEEDVPDWLRSSAPVDEEPAFEDEDDTPEWLRSSAPVDEEPLSEDEEEDIPDWLRSSAPVDEEPAFEDEDDTPEWLRSSAPVEEEPAFATQPQTSDEDFDLFSQLTADTGDSDLGDDDSDFDLLGALTQEYDEPPTANDEMAWLQNAAPAAPQAASEQDDFAALFDDETPEPVAEHDDLSGDDMAWLQNAAPTAASTVEDDFASLFDDETPAPAAEQDDLFGEDMAWLREVDAATAAPPVVPPASTRRPEATQPKSDMEFDDLDSLLASIGSTDLPAASLTEPTSVEFDDLFADNAFADLGEAEEDSLTPQTPDWLSGVSVGEVSASSIVRGQKDRPLEDLSDRLLNLRDEGLELGSADDEIIEFAPIVPTSPPITGSALQISADQKRNVALLEELVGSTPETAGGKATRKRRRFNIKLDRLIISLLVAAAVIAPFYVRALRIGNLPPASFAPESSQQRMFDYIDALQPGDKVLFAAEYGATAAGELDDSTRPLLQHILRRGAQPVIVSTNPIGLLHVSNIMTELAGDTLKRNTDYFIGRYIVGDNIGVRSYVQDLTSMVTTDIQGQSTSLVINSLDDFALIIAVIERTDSIRIWAEQVAPLTTSPILVASSYSASPLALPYMDSSGHLLAGLLVGFQDAYTYAQQLEGLPTPLPDTPTPTPVTPTPTPTRTPRPTREAIITTEEPTVEVTAEATDEAAATDEITATPASSTATATSQATTTAVSTGTPTATATSAPTLTLTTAPTLSPESSLFGEIEARTAVNVRSGPGTSFPPVTSVLPGTRVQVIGISDDEEWYNIRLVTGEEGWISSSLVDLEEESSFIPGMVGWGMSIMQQETPPTSAPQEYRDERWYGMTLGILVIIFIITVSNLFHLIRKLAQRKR